MSHPTDASQDSLHAGSPSDHTQEIHTSHQENNSPKEHSKPSKDLRCEWCFQNLNQTLAWDLWMLVFSIWSNIKQNEIHSFEGPLKQNSGIKFWGFQLPVSSTSAPENSNDVCSLHDERCFDWKCLSWLVCHWCVSCHKMLKRYVFKRGIMWSLSIRFIPHNTGSFKLWIQSAFSAKSKISACPEKSWTSTAGRCAPTVPTSTSWAFPRFLASIEASAKKGFSKTWCKKSKVLNECERIEPKDSNPIQSNHGI